MRTAFLVLAGAAGLFAQDTSATLGGVVRHAGDSVIPPIDVGLTLKQPPHTLFSVRTNHAGEFKFTVLPAGVYTLTLTQGFFRTLTLKTIQVASGEQKFLPPLEVEQAGSCGSEGPNLEYLELLPTEQHAGNLSGHVQRDEAHPVASATVKLLCDERKVCGETKTDSNGEFIFFDVPSRGDATIQVTHSGFYSWEGTDYEIREGFNSTYSPIILNSRLRPKPPVVWCE